MLRFLTKGIDLVDFNIIYLTIQKWIQLLLQYNDTLKERNFALFFFTNMYFHQSLLLLYAPFLLYYIIIIFLVQCLKWVISSFNPVFYCFFSIHTESSTILSCRLNDIYFDSYIFVVVVVFIKQEVQNSSRKRDEVKK